MNGERRWRFCIQGAVQGAGFRPFVYRLACELALKGRVNNSAQGVVIDVEGPPGKLKEFRQRLEAEKPPRALIQRVEFEELEPTGYTAFVIEHSDEAGEKTALILPDIATCSDCLKEIFDPHNRRYRHPFTNCTNCGPRFTIIEALPYDRPNTTMRIFPMCPNCQEEYENPLDRRFHAQPNACPQCGPHLELWDPRGRVLAEHDEALRLTAGAIRDGQIVAVKGLGGFHLVVDARDEAAVQELRERKRREEKPFALMYPSLEFIKAGCEVSKLEEQLLASPEAPIVLPRRTERGFVEIAPAVAPNNPYLGVMLPYTPLHHLLMAELGFPVVATSGNLSDEPICIDEREALERLRGIADLFLVHNRPIVRHVDDSVVRVIDGRAVIVRRARGYAPLPISLSPSWPREKHTVLAVGGHLKNTIAIAAGQDVFISQHIGDLDTSQARRAFRKVIRDFQALYECKPNVIVCDAHPDYASTQHARALRLPIVEVQHHVAHVWACLAEHGLGPPSLGVTWDGTGYGLDGTVWGGEFFVVTAEGFERVGRFRRFRLPGGEVAIQEPRRAALGLLYQLFGERAFEMNYLAPVRVFSQQELAILDKMLKQGVNAPITSSVGRLFDALASLLGLYQRTSFEGQAAMALEFAAEGAQTDEHYPFAIIDCSSEISVVDWGPIIQGILQDVRRGVPVAEIAQAFHNTLAETIVAVAKRVGLEQVVLSGGCFQNKSLAERALERLRAAGFMPYTHEQVPPNDGGIALGQIAAAHWKTARAKE
jgi:hydrogenase maturation protein HypF